MGTTIYLIGKMPNEEFEQLSYEIPVQKALEDFGEVATFDGGASILMLNHKQLKECKKSIAKQVDDLDENVILRAVEIFDKIYNAMESQNMLDIFFYCV